MRLNPKLPPGRANRKALQFAADIHQLRHAGYPFSAIRQALLDVGLSVSLSTVKREAARNDACATYPASATYTPRAAVRAHPVPPAATAATTTTTTASLPIATQPDLRCAKDEAEAFVRTQTTNLLVRAKEQP